MSRSTPDRSRIAAAVAALAAAAALLSAALAGPAQAADGTWERAWGTDVDKVAVGGFEICVVSANCQGGDATTSLGGHMDRPASVAVDPNTGNVYAADRFKNRIQKFDPNGNWLAAWGRDVIAGNGELGYEECEIQAICKIGTTGPLGGELNQPTSVAVDGQGFVYVADGMNHRVQKFASDGDFIRAWGKNVLDNGAGNTGFENCTVESSCLAGQTDDDLGGHMNLPFGIATDGSANVYVADVTNDRIQKFSATGDWEAAWGADVIEGAPTGFEVCSPFTADCQAGDSSGIAGGFQSPRDVATDASSVYVAENNNHRIQKFSLSGSWQLAWGKDVSDEGGTGFEICSIAADCQGGPSNPPFPLRGGEFNQPGGVATDAFGNVYTTEYTNRVQKFDSNGNWQRAWGADVVEGGGTGFEICTTAALCKQGSIIVVENEIGGGLTQPGQPAANSAGNLYVPDANRIQKFVDAPPGPPGLTPQPGAQPGPTGLRAAALKKCKKKKSKAKRRKCRKRARRLPV